MSKVSYTLWLLKNNGLVIISKFFYSHYKALSWLKQLAVCFDYCSVEGHDINADNVTSYHHVFPLHLKANMNAAHEEW